MLLELKTPQIMPEMKEARIETVYARAGQALKVGDRILDVSIDLGSAFQLNCPPMSYYRLVAREKGWLRELNAAPGDLRAAGDVLARVSTEPDEPVDAPADRPLRLATAGILGHPMMWSAKPRP